MALLVVILPEHHRECMLRKGKGSDGVEEAVGSANRTQGQSICLEVDSQWLSHPSK